MAASIATRDGLKRGPVKRSPCSSTKKSKTSNQSSSTEVAPHLKVSISYKSEELALKALTMLPPEVQITSATFYKYWMECWQSFMESSECADVFTTMVSQTVRAFGTAIKAEALVKNLVNKNKGYMTHTSEVEEEAKKASIEVEALKKCQAEESVKLTLHWQKLKI